MEEPNPDRNMSVYPDLFGHLVMLKLYTPLCLCFPTGESFSRSQIINKLTIGLERLSTSFPWLAGQVIGQDIAKGHNRLSNIIPLDVTCGLIVKDLSPDDAVASMDVLQNAKFPSSMLDGKMLSPLHGLPTTYEADPAPVFFLQANFIKGGLLLTFAGEHSTMDGQAFGQVVRLFNKACHNEPFTEEELLHGNRLREHIVPLLDKHTYKAGPELNYLIENPDIISTASWDSALSTCTWAYFHFPSSSLSKLKSKSLSSKCTSENGSIDYITTNDAISAFIWQSTCRIRSIRLPPQRTSTFARAVDVRASLSIPDTYLGNMSNHTYNTLPLHSVRSRPLGSLASSLRSALDPSKLSYGIRSLATQLSLTADKSKVHYGANMDLSTDMFLSSWAKLPCYNLDFDLGLGFPQSVRRPRFEAVEGLMYLMPMDRSGAIDAAICLSDEDLQGLKLDREFGEFAEWIG